MKTTIKSAALFLLASASLFIATTAKAVTPLKDEITFSSMPSHKGVEIKVQSAIGAKAIVIIYDQDKNVIFKNALPAYKVMERGYVLDQLDNGDYTIEVTANRQTVTKALHVYDEDGTKEFIMGE